MDPIDIHFIASAAAPLQYPKPLQSEFVFVGRSNVGKSSLLNAVFKKRLAHVSSSPGKTRTINFFKWQNALFVDVPGYGYARLSRTEREGFQAMMELYFENGRPLALVFLLIDGRHEVSPLDRTMKAYFDALGIPHVLVLTKWDTLKRNEQVRNLKQFEAEWPNDTLLPTSAKTSDGVAQIWRELYARCPALKR